MKIDKDIPMDTRTRTKIKYAWVEDMKVGDSVGFDDLAEMQKVYRGIRRSFSPFEFQYRTQRDGSFRIWRTK